MAVEASLLTNTFKGFYYSLSGKPAQVEVFLSTPFKKAERLFRDAFTNIDESMVYRIAKFATAFFMSLLALPLKGAAQAIQFVYREKINPQTFKKEYEAWNQLVFQNLDGDMLIKKFIKSRLLASECRFGAIACVSLRDEGKSVNLINADGRCGGLRGSIKEGKKCLIICFPERLSDSKYFLTHFKSESEAKFVPNQQKNLDEPSFQLQEFYRKFTAELAKEEGANYQEIEYQWLGYQFTENPLPPSFANRMMKTEKDE